MAIKNKNNCASCSAVLKLKAELADLGKKFAGLKAELEPRQFTLRLDQLETTFSDFKRDDGKRWDAQSRKTTDLYSQVKDNSNSIAAQSQANVTRVDEFQKQIFKKLNAQEAKLDELVRNLHKTDKESQKADADLKVELLKRTSLIGFVSGAVVSGLVELIKMMMSKV